jgi:hypothetical protein
MDPARWCKMSTAFWYCKFNHIWKTPLCYLCNTQEFQGSAVDIFGALFNLLCWGIRTKRPSDIPGMNFIVTWKSLHNTNCGTLHSGQFWNVGVGTVRFDRLPTLWAKGGFLGLSWALDKTVWDSRALQVFFFSRKQKETLGNPATHWVGCTDPCGHTLGHPSCGKWIQNSQSTLFFAWPWWDDQEGHSSKPAQANSSLRPYLKVGGVAQGVRPWVQTPVPQK